MHTECTLHPHPRGWQSLGTWGWPCCGTTSLLQGAGLEPGAAGCLGGVMAPLWSRTPNSSDEESSKLSQLAVPAHCTSLEKRRLAVPGPWGPPQPLSRCPSVPLALGSEVLNLVLVPSCLNTWFGRIGFSARYDRSLSPCPMYPIQDGGDFLSASAHQGPHLGRGTDRAVRVIAVIPGGCSDANSFVSLLPPPLLINAVT